MVIPIHTQSIHGNVSPIRIRYMNVIGVEIDQSDYTIITDVSDISAINNVSMIITINSFVHL